MMQPLTLSCWFNSLYRCISFFLLPSFHGSFQKTAENLTHGSDYNGAKTTAWTLYFCRVQTGSLLYKQKYYPHIPLCTLKSSPCLYHIFCANLAHSSLRLMRPVTLDSDVKPARYQREESKNKPGKDIHHIDWIPVVFVGRVRSICLPTTNTIIPPFATQGKLAAWECVTVKHPFQRFAFDVLRFILVAKIECNVWGSSSKTYAPHISDQAKIGSCICYIQRHINIDAATSPPMPPLTRSLSYGTKCPPYSAPVR